MKNWKEACNYRRIKGKNGIVYAVRIDSKWIRVSPEVYAVYSQMGRQERYQEEKMADIPCLSFEKLIEDNVPIDRYIAKHLPSAEDIVIEKENETERRNRIALLPEAMAQLSDEERQLIQSLYFENISLREYAKVLGVPVMTLHYRLQKTLKKLKSFFL